MSTLFSAVNKNSVRTTNGMKTQASSESSLVDLFFKWGASRGKFDILKTSLVGAFATDKDLAVRILLWGRDARTGAGERQLFKDSINFIAENEMLTLEEAVRVLNKVPELGRYDDLFVFVDTALEDEAFALLYHAIFVANNGLAAKWTPRKGVIANKFRKFLGLTPKQYRKALVERTNVVETAMCAKDWNSIDFSKIPSVAAARYQKAFLKNAPETYASYKSALVKGDPSVKVNAKGVYPYDVIKSIRRGDVTVANAQWKALPNFMEGSESCGILPVVDVSGSMTCFAGGNPEITCLDVAISLGLYISERNRGVFKDQFITFSSTPKMLKTKGELWDRVNQMARSDWGMSTDLNKVFTLILNAAVAADVPVEEMPDTILILSDMQFNQCVRHGDSAMQMIERKYKNAGYPLPKVVFWNINNSNGVPVSFDKSGTALVSGFSPSIMASILKAEEVTPLSMMKTTLMDEKYNW